MREPARAELGPVNAKNRDFFAELYVAGILGDAGWSIYFPKRDVGFDFIAVKQLRGTVVLRPVQVKGKYPAGSKGDKAAYGYTGELSQLHPEMVLAIPYFPTDQRGVAPTCTAYMPCWAIRSQASKGWACQPARFVNGVPKARRDFQLYFDYAGMELMELEQWSIPHEQRRNR
jgi:hypothetical protein